MLFSPQAKGAGHLAQVWVLASIYRYVRCVACDLSIDRGWLSVLSGRADLTSEQDISDWYCCAVSVSPELAAGRTSANRQGQAGVVGEEGQSRLVRCRTR